MNREGMRRIQVYADAETKRRVELAAAKHNLSITVYCLEAIIQQLAEDEVLDETHIEVPVMPTARLFDRQMLAQMRGLRDRIKLRRGGKLITTE